MQLLHDLDPRDGAAKVEFTHCNVRTTEHGLVKLGVSFSAGSVTAETKDSLDQSLEQNSVMVMYRQTFYSIAFRPPDGANAFFAPEVTVGQVRGITSGDNPPAYLSQVDYGRLLIVSITGEKASSELLASLSAGVKAASETAAPCPGSAGGWPRPPRATGLQRRVSSASAAR